VLDLGSSYFLDPFLLHKRHGPISRPMLFFHCCPSVVFKYLVKLKQCDCNSILDVRLHATESMLRAELMRQFWFGVWCFGATQLDCEEEMFEVIGERFMWEIFFGTQFWWWSLCIFSRASKFKQTCHLLLLCASYENFLDLPSILVSCKLFSYQKY